MRRLGSMHDHISGCTRSGVILSSCRLGFHSLPYCHNHQNTDLCICYDIYPYEQAHRAPMAMVSLFLKVFPAASLQSSVIQTSPSEIVTNAMAGQRRNTALLLVAVLHVSCLSVSWAGIYLNTTASFTQSSRVVSYVVCHVHFMGSRKELSRSFGSRYGCEKIGT